MKKYLIFLNLLIIVILSGCGAIQRHALMKNNYPSYPEEIRSAIDNGKIIMGMNKEQVYLSLGTTFCTQSANYKGSAVEVWAYHPNPFTGKPSAGTYDCRVASQKVIFENGIVVGWENL